MRSFTSRSSFAIPAVAIVLTVLPAAAPAHRLSTTRASHDATVPAVAAPHGPGVWDYTSESELEWPTWGNTIAYGAPDQAGIADCTFAAIADWELLKGLTPPSQHQLVREFIAAGGNENGLYQRQWEYWLGRHGVGGHRIRLVRVPNSWMDGEIQGHGAVIADVGGHTLVVAGFSSAGPEVITFGETRTETWAEWNEFVEDVFVPVLL